MDLRSTPLFGLIGERMRWLEQRQAVLAQNIANADTPDYRARELAAMDFGHWLRQAGGAASVEQVATHPGHQGIGAAGAFAVERQDGSFETQLSGNNVVLDEQLMKVSETVLEHQQAANLYSRYVGMLKLALGFGSR